MLQQSQECVMVVYLERRSEKKLKWREKKPHSQQCWDSAKKASSSSCVSPCPGEGKSIEAKFWLYREESPATDTVFSQVPWSQTDIAVALFITSYNRQTTLTLLQWAQKQAKKKKNWKSQSVLFPTYILCPSKGGKALLCDCTRGLKHSSILDTTLVSSPHFNIHLLLTNTHI